MLGRRVPSTAQSGLPPVSPTGSRAALPFVGLGADQGLQLGGHLGPLGGLALAFQQPRLPPTGSASGYARSAVSTVLDRRRRSAGVSNSTTVAYWIVPAARRSTRPVRRLNRTRPAGVAQALPFLRSSCRKAVAVQTGGAGVLSAATRGGPFSPCRLHLGGGPPNFATPQLKRLTRPAAPGCFAGAWGGSHLHHCKWLPTRANGYRISRCF